MNAAPVLGFDLLSLEEMGFQRTNLEQLGIHGGETAAHKLLDDFVEKLTRENELRFKR